ncbi:hypothetical protein GS881_24075 [Rhodococcus hoagii]|nr:hypothetical protein [Prescottella equi]
MGRAIARRFAADGIRVLAVSRSMRAGDGRLQGSLEETVAQIRADGGTAQPLVFDLGDPDGDRASVIAHAEKVFGAPVDHRQQRRGHTALRPVVRRDDSGVLYDSVETNVWAGWDLATAAVPGMRQRGAGGS